MSLKCEICDVPIQSEVVMRDHVKGKKHRHLAAVYEKRKQLAERSVYIRGHLGKISSEAVKKHFCQYGTVESVFVEKDRGYGFVEFRQLEAVGRATNKTNTIGGVYLTVRPRELKNISFLRKNKAERKTSDDHVAAPVFSHEDLLTKLHTASSVSAQMSLVKQELELSTDDMQKRTGLVHKLQQFFRTMFPGACVHPFGSSVNGLGVKGCDMDLFLDLGLNDASTMSHPNYHNEIKFPVYLKGLTSLRGPDGKVSLSSFGSAPIHDQIRVIGRLLCNPDLGCLEVFTIPSARCPVVKFTHKTSGIKCDLTINNRLALRNTRLIHLIVSSDKRIQELMYTIRYWCKLKELAGNINSGPLLTNYALTMMVFFFLQNVDSPVVPSVEDLAALADPDNPEESVTIEGWNCTFTADRTRFPAISNAMGVEELLQKFFYFYSKFDLVNKVICPRQGKQLELVEFKTGAAPYLSQFKVGPMNVQDPFVLEHNTAQNVNDKTKDRYTTEFRQAMAKIQHPKYPRPESDASSDQEDQSWGISFLFSKESVLPNLKNPTDSNREMTRLITCLNPHFFVMFQPSKLDYSQYSHCRTTLQVKAEWVLRTCSLVIRVLEELMLFSCEEICDSRDRWKESVICKNGQELPITNLSTEKESPKKINNSSQSRPSLTENNCNSGSQGKQQESSTKLVDLDPQIQEIATIELSECGSNVSMKRMSPNSPERLVKKRKGNPVSLSEQEESGEIPEDDGTSNVCEAITVNVPESSSRLAESNNPFLQSIMRVSTKGENTESPSTGHHAAGSCNRPCPVETRHDSKDDKVSSEGKEVMLPRKLENCPLMEYTCTAFQKMWISRKSIRKEIRQQSPNVLDECSEWEVEEQVTKLLQNQLQHSVLDPCIEFTLLASAECLTGDTTVVLEFKPTLSAQKEFSNFFPFFKTFFSKLVEFQH